MSDPLTWLLAWMAGAVLGALFFGGLWWTVRRLVSTSKPALWVLVSLVVRSGGAVAGFYFVSGGHPDRLLLCLLGFVMARAAVTRLTRGAEQTQGCQAHEASHAP